MNERKEKIIKAYEECKNFSEVGRRFDLTPERVRQIYYKSKINMPALVRELSSFIDNSDSIKMNGITAARNIYRTLWTHWYNESKMRGINCSSKVLTPVEYITLYGKYTKEDFMKLKKIGEKYANTLVEFNKYYKGER